MELDTIVCAEALAYLQSLPDCSVNCIVTSPPYFGLRDYGVDGQIGLEPTPQAFVAKLVEVFHEARRVLRDDGTCWINLGDSYTGTATIGGSGNRVDGGTPYRIQGLPSKEGKPKDLMGIPWRVAFALQDDGWYLRSDIIWHKPNPMPESVTDRPTKAHEYVFLLTKSERYWYDNEAIKEPAVEGDPTSPRGSNGNTRAGAGRRDKQSELGNRRYTGFNERWDTRNQPLKTRNRRTVWTVATEPNSFAHFATFPQKLIEPIILAGCPVGGTTLDMFMGSGTTALVTRNLGRHYLGCDLSPEYVKMANDRLRQPFAPLQSAQNSDVSDLPLFSNLESES